MFTALLLVLAATPVPEALTVPAELTAKTCTPELSGIAWVSALNRYLVVSDDTGVLDTKTWHAPWLFTVDTKGAFDSDSRVIEGTDSLDDGESLTPGPDGTFFLTTSHVMTPGKKSKPARRQLLWLDVSAKGITTRGRFDLTTLDPEQLAAPGAEELDIEAIAFKDGALFVGLKAPLDGEGRATILRVEKIADAFAGKKPAASVWAKLKLEVPDAKGALVPQGVTDLLFLSDGRLVLAANAPKSGKPDGGGALWLLAKADAKPELLHRFDKGLKPEGLTFTPDGKKIVVVFDRGQDGAQWVHVSVP